MAENDDDQETAHPGRAVGRIHVTPVRDPFQNPATKPAAAPQPIQVEARPANQQPTSTTNAVRIPDSLSNPVQSASLRSVARIAPSLLAALEPVSLSEEISRRLLLQKVLPSYPEQAVKARLQGPVVLQAWIGRDGTIQDLKLVRGSFLLGQAAYRAVKQWRYQPYLVNGRAVYQIGLVTPLLHGSISSLAKQERIPRTSFRCLNGAVPANPCLEQPASNLTNIGQNFLRQQPARDTGSRAARSDSGNPRHVQSSAPDCSNCPESGRR